MQFSAAKMIGHEKVSILQCNEYNIFIKSYKKNNIFWQKLVEACHPFLCVITVSPSCQAAVTQRPLVAKKMCLKYATYLKTDSSPACRLLVQ